MEVSYPSYSQSTGYKSADCVSSLEIVTMEEVSVAIPHDTQPYYSSYLSSHTLSPYLSYLLLI